MLPRHLGRKINNRKCRQYGSFKSQIVTIKTNLLLVFSKQGRVVTPAMDPRKKRKKISVVPLKWFPLAIWWHPNLLVSAEERLGRHPPTPTPLLRRWRKHRKQLKASEGRLLRSGFWSRHSWRFGSTRTPAKQIKLLFPQLLLHRDPRCPTPPGDPHCCLFAYTAFRWPGQPPEVNDRATPVPASEKVRGQQSFYMLHRFSSSSLLLLHSKHTPTQTCLLLSSIYGETRWEDTWEPDTTFTAHWCEMMEWPIWFRCSHSLWPALFCGPADPSCQESSGTSAELIS